ncbi:MAG: hypothetical protein COU29_00275 [Candidatus Magasanikbacteria bacterium CG10_big_fil_rev_8_21_14_0_10_36_32]|uniref:Colicin V production protein n=1 Tax=Candidatus Magasanikbacteria bacterium CG10_big_fil_rev_8_21_14_0_10_36_32 TaxID=1974646 RepID=A0A2M6W7U5_9BACT|nr:MAG: hypothetical protein COU29_00275 [Candidatus Magasanikbacteria bacterium CG10_big_fil_rev_8_21_14_0_10_36_32]
MSFFDLVVVIIIGGFGLFGLWFGLIHTLGSLAGTVLGVYLAARFYEPLAGWLMQFTGWSGNFSKVIMFILAFIIINRLVGLGFWFVDKILSIITRLPFIKSINRLLGLAFGLFEGALVLGIIFYFIAHFPLSEWFMTNLSESEIAPSLTKMASILWPLLPDALKTVQTTVDSAVQSAVDIVK